MTPCGGAASDALCLIKKFETSFPCDSGGHDFCICMNAYCFLHIHTSSVFIWTTQTSPRARPGTATSLRPISLSN